MSLPIDFEKATQNDLCPRHKSKADKKRLQRNILRHKWRVSAHLLPQASKYRAASLGCLATTHYYLRLFREEKARVEEMEIMGPHRPWLQSLQHRVRRAGRQILSAVITPTTVHSLSTVVFFRQHATAGARPCIPLAGYG